jgi:hypothetical protein
MQAALFCFHAQHRFMLPSTCTQYAASLQLPAVLHGR